MGRLITYGEIRASAGLEPPAAGTLFFSTQNQDGCIMDGVFSEQERRIWTAGQAWYATSGTCGTLFNRLILKRQLPVEVALYYRQERGSRNLPTTPCILIGVRRRIILGIWLCSGISRRPRGNPQTTRRSRREQGNLQGEVENLPECRSQALRDQWREHSERIISRFFPHSIPSHHPAGLES